MPGQPQLREAARLYAPDDRREPRVPLALVRLEQRMDGSGKWDLYLNDPAEEQPPQHGEFPDEDSARAELARIYEAGTADGDWDIHRPEPY